MNIIDELEFNYQLFLDKSTVLYGGSSTGKSTIIVDILYQLKPHVDQIIVIAPTDPQNHTYSGETESERVVPTPCIHYAISDKLLRDFEERQQALTSIYKKANDYQILKRLFDRLNIPGVENSIKNVMNIRMQREEEIRSQFTDPAVVDARIAKINNSYREFIKLIYKKNIIDNRHKYEKMQINDSEKFAIKYLDLNPRAVIIFDDCTEQLEKFKNHPVMQKLAFQCRHLSTTVLVACHSDKKLDTSFKSNAFVSIFTEENVAKIYYNKSSLGSDSESKARIKTVCKSVFTPLLRYQKLAWVREENKFYRFTSTPRHGFKFGCQWLWNYCNKIQSNEFFVSADNKFISGFL